MRGPKLSFVFLMAGVTAFSACSDDTSTTTASDNDGGGRPDGTTGNDGGGTFDGGSDSSGVGDAGKDSGNDAGRDAGVDAGRDSGIDAGKDSAGAVDAAPDNVIPVGDAGCVAQAPSVPALQFIPVSTSTFGFSTFARQPPGSSDWYVVRQTGVVLIVRNGQLRQTPFLDVSAGMGTSAGERGLLSIAFHPDYAQNGRFFVMGTPTENANGSFAPANADAVVEFRRDPNNPDVAVGTKVRDIVVLGASDTNHNGGTIQFGPDNYLYVGTGDGGGGCESAKPGTVQDPTELYGKILRLDVDAAAPFAAPGNPFAADPRVYHYGLRNPFRWNFDSHTGDLYIGDVGQDRYEEISIAVGNAPGMNFGWPAHEGNSQGTCGNEPLGGPSPYTPPIVSIDRNGSGPFNDFSAIMGGIVYRGSAIPQLQGVYLFADYNGGELGALRYCGGQTYGPVAVQLSQITTPSGSPSQITSFVEGNDGEVYVTYDTGSTRVGRIALQ